MIQHQRNINMYPGVRAPERIHLSQYDSDFTLVFSLYSSAGSFSVDSGTTVMIRGTKGDGNGYSANASLSGTTVTVQGNNQMTAVAGPNTFELVLTRSGKVLSTANFILDVEPAAMDADTIQSETVLKELQAIIDSASTSTAAATRAEEAATAAEGHAEGTVRFDIAQSKTETEKAQARQNIGAVEPSEIDDLKEDLSDMQDEIDSFEGISDNVKTALLACFEKVAWIDASGQSYYDDLYNALYEQEERHYIQDGLIVHFDGINNTGSGHDSSANKWVDLINGYQMNFVESVHTTWGSNCINLAGGEWSAQGLMSNGRLWTPATNTTIEVVLQCETPAKNQSVVCLDSENTTSSGTRAHRHICLYNDNTIGFISTSSNTFVNTENDFTSIKQIAATYNGYSVTSAYINGNQAIAGSVTHSYRLGTPNEYIGYGDATNYNMSLKGKIYAVRVYNRALTATELAHNLACDNKRFRLGLVI